MPLFYLLGIWWGFKIALCNLQEILVWFNSEQGCFRSCSRLCSCRKNCVKYSRAPTTAGTNSITFAQPQYSPPSRHQETKTARFLLNSLWVFWGGVCVWGFIFKWFIHSCSWIFKDRRKAWWFCRLSCKTQAIDYHSADSANVLKKPSVKC